MCQTRYIYKIEYSPVIKKRVDNKIWRSELQSRLYRRNQPILVLNKPQHKKQFSGIPTANILSTTKVLQPTNSVQCN